MSQELHPFDHSSLSDLFEVDAEWHIKGNTLHIHSVFSGPVHFLEYDKSAAPAAKDELWKKTCFECFLLKANSTEYTEWNFSPGGDFQRYEFGAYRERDSSAPAPTKANFSIKWAISGEKLEARLEIPLHTDVQKIQICWVAKSKVGETMYWALSHTSPKPDFHNIDAFSMVVA